MCDKASIIKENMHSYHHSTNVIEIAEIILSNFVNWKSLLNIQTANPVCIF